MNKIVFSSDLHGNVEKYEKLFSFVIEAKPMCLLLGGDLLPGISSRSSKNYDDFVNDYLIPRVKLMLDELSNPDFWIGLILGNDDPRAFETEFLQAEKNNLWVYLHNKKLKKNGLIYIGYSFVPPTPFRLKDWEKFDVSRFVDIGCIEPFEGSRSVNPDYDAEYSTIEKDLLLLTQNIKDENVIMLFHAPPYQTNLDRAALDGKMIDHVPLDVHVGSIAIRRMVENFQPLVTLHGHIHESASITGSWSDLIGKTYLFSGAHNGKEVAVVIFDPHDLQNAQRFLL
ncbi:MAG: hypothetical protein A2X08_16070 [Bacteroidetes bacterium GWA2_32_17]|nr:MAG: hypothetical protein A2X08_16070 [Bacteroidetes bacterium GWA2_32_17]